MRASEARESSFRGAVVPTSPLKKYKGVVPSPASNGPPSKQAYLEKLNHFGTSWQRRFFVLGPRTLSYFHSDKKDVMDAQIDLRYVTLVSQSDNPRDRVIDLFLADDKLGDKSRRYRLRATTRKHATDWCLALRGAQIHASKLAEPGSTTPTQEPEFFPLNGQQGAAPNTAHAPDAHKSLPDALLRLWLFLVLLALALAVAALLPMPFLTMWFLKVGLLCGVLHANVLKVYGGLLVCSAAGMALTAKHHRPLFRTAVLLVLGSGCVLTAPTLRAVPLANQLPARLAEFLAASGLGAVQPQHVFDQNLHPGKEAKPFSVGEYLRDPPCALSNGSEFRHLAHTVTYKSFNASERPGVAHDSETNEQMLDWSGLGGIYEGHADDHLQLTLFRPPPGPQGHQSLPVLVSLHGGGWYSGSMYDGLQCYLRQALGVGFAVVTAEYRLGERGWRGDHMLADVQDVVHWITTDGKPLGLDHSRVVLIGGSSGAHLALTAAYTLNAQAKRHVIQGVVARYGATDLEAAWQRPQRLYSGWVGLGWDERTAVEHITGGAPSEATAQAYRNLSPIAHVGPHTPPTIMLHCRQDEFYSAAVHADGLRSALAEARVPHLLLDPPLHSHGCDIGSTAPFQMLRFALTHFLAAVADVPPAPGGGTAAAAAAATATAADGAAGDATAADVTADATAAAAAAAATELPATAYEPVEEAVGEVEVTADGVSTAGTAAAADVDAKDEA